MKTRRGGLRLPQFLLAPASRPTLVGLLHRYLELADTAGPDWPTVVEDAVLRQDMEWVEAQLKAAFDMVGPPPGWTGRATSRG